LAVDFRGVVWCSLCQVRVGIGVGESHFDCELHKVALERLPLGCCGPGDGVVCDTCHVLVVEADFSTHFNSRSHFERASFGHGYVVAADSVALGVLVRDKPHWLSSLDVLLPELLDLVAQYDVRLDMHRVGKSSTSCVCDMIYGPVYFGRGRRSLCTDSMCFKDLLDPGDAVDLSTESVTLLSGGRKQ